MKKVLLPLLLFVSLISNAQNETNVWYFGYGAGLDFNSGTPVPLTNGVIGTNEGCASIADRTTGVLLFYTDGSTIWDVNHNVMPGGTGLGGDNSSSQSGIIVPDPGNPDGYYVFSVAAVGNGGGVKWAYVDMNMNGGLGSVTSSMNQLAAPTGEKINATKHANGTDFWVVTHAEYTNEYFAYQVSASGVGPAVITATGSTPTSWGAAIGYLKFSPDGTMLAYASDFDIILEVFEFDNATGIVGANIFTDNVWPPGGFGNLGPYGLTFSPDNTLLYVTSDGDYNIYQYDVTLGSPAAILASENVIGTSASLPFALQIGPDGIVYVALYTTGYVGTISYPNVYGTGCVFTDNAIYLNGGTCYLGLPDFIESFFEENIDCVLNTTICDSTLSYTFLDTLVESPSTVLWDFGDPNSGADNSDTLRNTYHDFSAAGTYTVTLTVYTPSDTFTIDSTITIPVSTLTVDAGIDHIMCITDQIQIDATITSASIITWTPAAGLSCADCEDPIATPSVTTTYILTAEDIFGCEISDTIEITVISEVVAFAEQDTLVCEGVPVELSASGGTDYLWFPTNLFTDPTLQFQEISLYTSYTIGVEVSVPGGCPADTAYVIVSVQAIPLIDAGPDVVIATGESTQLNATGTGVTYSWTPTDGLSDANISNPDASPTITTTYYVTTTDALGCVATDSVIVKVGGFAVIPNAFTPNGDGINDYFTIYAQGVDNWQLMIFNRWGQMVYQTTDLSELSNPAKGWDGTYNGQPQGMGSFVYYVEMEIMDTDNPGQTIQKTMKGNITLIR